MVSIPASPPAPRRRSSRPFARLLAAGVALALLVGASGCGSDSDDDETKSTIDAEVGDPATLDSSTTTAETSPPETTPTTTAAPVGSPDPEAAAATLYTAWKADDRPTAATVAEPTAVDGIFASAPGDYSLYNRCNTGEFGQSQCLYRGDAGTIQFSMQDRSGSWVVTTAIFSPA